MSDRKMTRPGGSEGARGATGEAPGLGAQKSRRQFRMSAGRKEAVVLRVLDPHRLRSIASRNGSARAPAKVTFFASASGKTLWWSLNVLALGRHLS